MNQENLTKQAIELLQKLIETPSFSSEEEQTALLISKWLTDFKIPHQQQQNNIWAVNEHFDENKPTLLLNSHHDTVKPNQGYTRNPFKASMENGKLYGLGSNDAGGCLVSLLATFVYYYHSIDLTHNIVIVASAEEESSGKNGLNSMLNTIPNIDVAIVGEPTLLDLAIAEKGLVVFDAKVTGTSSHAAHPNTDNAMYKLIDVLQWFKTYQFKKTSEVLGDVVMKVTQINGGKQHNVIPSEINLVVDVRVNDRYTNKEITEILQKESPCSSIVPRSLRLNSSSIPKHHKLIQSGIKLGMKTYGSPTLSDQAALSCPSLKLGPGNSLRSHTADEFIFVEEIEKGIETYIQLLNTFLKA